MMSVVLVEGAVLCCIPGDSQPLCSVGRSVLPLDMLCLLPLAVGASPSLKIRSGHGVYKCWGTEGQGPKSSLQTSTANGRTHACLFRALYDNPLRRLSCGGGSWVRPAFRSHVTLFHV